MACYKSWFLAPWKMFEHCKYIEEKLYHFWFHNFSILIQRNYIHGDCSFDSTRMIMAVFHFDDFLTNSDCRSETPAAMLGAPPPCTFMAVLLLFGKPVPGHHHDVLSFDWPLPVVVPRSCNVQCKWYNLMLRIHAKSKIVYIQEKNHTLPSESSADG